MLSLHSLTHVESLSASNNNSNTTPSQYVKAISHAYVKYLQVFRRLSRIHDLMSHPQRRSDVFETLKLCMLRVVELKHRLVEWHVRDPSVIGSDPNHTLPWEYVNLRNVLIDLKLSPTDLEIPVPTHFPENPDRDSLVDGYVQLRLGSSGKQWLEEHPRELDAPLIELSLSEALETIMRNERGRQGIVRGVLLRDLKSRASVQNKASSASSLLLDGDEEKGGNSSPSSNSNPSVAILSLQRMFRGHAARSYVTAKRDEELSFIGMRRRVSTDHRIEELLKEASLDRSRRKAVQKERELVCCYVESLFPLSHIHSHTHTTGLHKKPG